jgi:hypothetical protein
MASVDGVTDIGPSPRLKLGCHTPPLECDRLDCPLRSRGVLLKNKLQALLNELLERHMLTL